MFYTVSHHQERTVTAGEFGSELWWKKQQGPAWVREEQGYRVTFLWRDPQGSEKTSDTIRVWLYITGVTDHHHDTPPQCMQRVSGTDVWRWETILPAEWRGSYCFIPSSQASDFGQYVPGDPHINPLAIRQGWKKLLPQAIADPLNSLSWSGGRGHPFSGLSLPDAPPQPGWDDNAPSCQPPACFVWHSQRLENHRRIWVYTTGEDTGQDKPLAILLDGQFWAESMPIWQPITTLTQTGHLPPAVYILIDVIDEAHRSLELPCYADFWLAVQEELLPLVKSSVAFTDKPEQTLVAGQSFGGLAALYAGLNWPERFGCVLSQSGSFWWPDRQGKHQGQLIEALSQGKLSASGLRIVLQAGRREPLILHVNRQLYPLLAHAKQRISCEIEGGHDALCWRGGLTAGLMTLWQSSGVQAASLSSR
ncbi:enterochelin esterase [Citrobacter sp. JGM124]|uniref:enterochelin esterase n=1 Tax=Citrobacter sp. JGM124 TaxID=2799789 RepID=UPI001BACDE8F|nr:enterochelin esterase [Citrobacter sp. JGM124]